MDLPARLQPCVVLSCRASVGRGGGDPPAGPGQQEPAPVAASEGRPAQAPEEQAAEQRGRPALQSQAQAENDDHPATDDDEAAAADAQLSTPWGL